MERSIFGRRIKSPEILYAFSERVSASSGGVGDDRCRTMIEPVEEKAISLTLLARNRFRAR